MNKTTMDGEVLRAFRHMRGLRQSELASRLGVTQQRVSDLELGKVEISNNEQRTLGRALKLRELRDVVVNLLI